MTQKELNELLGDMSLEEKIGQLVQVPGSCYEENAVITGEMNNGWREETCRLAGSTLGIYGAKKLKKIQDEYMRTQPHHIPLLFMLDVIHGHRTVFPCPLGQGATFSPEISEECAKVAAKEAGVDGVQVTFAPMADLVRDSRWGRVMESTGEDPYLNSLMAAAMVKGFQGDDVGEKGRIASCIKHVAAYGGAVAGLDYQNVELSEHTLREFYLPAYKAAVDAGCELAMTSFNLLNGVPSSGNKWLMRDVLRGEWGFDGVLISDWGAVCEMVAHGCCEDNTDAAIKAMETGVDIEMCTPAYADNLERLVNEGKISQKLVDEAVMRVLQLKNKLGLFENPYKDADEQIEQTISLCAEHRALARRAVRESIVLLKNKVADKVWHEATDKAADETQHEATDKALDKAQYEAGNGCGKILPLDVARDRKLAFIGPYIEGQDMRSSWSISGDEKDNVTLKEAAKEAFCGEASLESKVSSKSGASLESQTAEKTSAVELRFAAGCTFLDNHTVVNLGQFDMADDEWESVNEKMLSEAVECARWADKVVLALGEHRFQSGEATSKTDITLPKIQMELLRRVAAVNKNVITVLFNGRPLDLREVSEYSKAIVEAWMPGTEGGHGIMDVLTGAYNPTGRLPMSFPYSVGQLPMSYNHYSCGRPKPAEGRGDYTSRYLDAPNEPLYPFGYGLSYTLFEIGNVSLNADKLSAADKLTASVNVKNTGKTFGTQLIQLYIRDVAASKVRPVKELKGFKRVELAPGEIKRVSFEISEEMLRFFRADGSFASEPGSFKVWIADSSRTEGEPAEFIFM